jgi:Flp pilus assembly secretin CpaC
MRAIVACGFRRSRFHAVLAAAVAAGVPAAAQATEPVAATFAVAAAGEPVTVYLDQAKLLRLPEQTATLVVGNPLIADVTVQPGGILVVTGKSYGVTNLVALDRNGSVLMEHPIQVQGPRDVVVVYRGVERESYSCMPNCERRITLGDSANYFTATLTQSGNLNAIAQGGPPSK